MCEICDEMDKLPVSRWANLLTTSVMFNLKQHPTAGILSVIEEYKGVEFASTLLAEVLRKLADLVDERSKKRTSRGSRKVENAVNGKIEEILKGLSEEGEGK